MSLLPLPPGEGRGEGSPAPTFDQMLRPTTASPHPSPLPEGEGIKRKPLPGGEGISQVTTKLGASNAHFLWARALFDTPKPFNAEKPGERVGRGGFMSLLPLPPGEGRGEGSAPKSSLPLSVGQRPLGGGYCASGGFSPSPRCPCNAGSGYAVKQHIGQRAQRPLRSCGRCNSLSWYAQRHRAPVAGLQLYPRLCTVLCIAISQHSHQDGPLRPRAQRSARHASQRAHIRQRQCAVTRQRLDIPRMGTENGQSHNDVSVTALGNYTTNALTPTLAPTQGHPMDEEKFKRLLTACHEVAGLYEPNIVFIGGIAVYLHAANHALKIGRAHV